RHLPGFFPRARLNVPNPLFPQTVAGMAGFFYVGRRHLPYRVHVIWGDYRALFDRRAARVGPALGDRQGEASAVAVSVLRPRQFAGTLAPSGGVEPRNGRPATARRVNGGMPMTGKIGTAKHAGIALATLLGGLAMAAPALAQNEQFIPMLVYRTGAYAPNGVPFANGLADYYNLVNERDGGINGVKIVFEECDTGYATDRGVECYERLKGKGPTGAAYVIPLSTGITFALTEKAPTDKIPIISMGYGRSESRDGSVFQWNFPLLGTYWTAADIILHFIADQERGWDKMKGKRIALVYHDSPYGKEPIALLQKRAQMHGFETMFLPVTHPGVEQKATWLQIRQNRPDYVLLWGWGVMNSTAIKEAVAVGYPREKMYGVWWSGAEQDVRPAEEGAKGYNSAALQHTAGQFQLHQDL